MRFDITYLIHDPLLLEQYEHVQTFKNGGDTNSWDESQCVRTNKAIGIVNDGNCYAVGTVADRSKSLELLQHVITASLNTMINVQRHPTLKVE